MEEAVQVNIEDFKQFNHKSVIDICNKSDSELFAYFQDILHKSDNIAPGTTIVSDLWRAYFRIGELPDGYRHLTVNHSLNFVNPDDPAANTQTVESSWQKLKIPLKAKYGTCRDHYADYITEHCWRKEFGRNNEAFYHFWVHLLQHYSPQWV
uniref:ISXO2-like transposase domain-containing protein n=1 Tax=Panagrolaimus davidi TaxID=227884 RepID=A0A914PNS1_9BILA